MADGLPLETTIEAYGEARGNLLDVAWARGVSWTLQMRNVEAGLVREGLEEGLAVVRDSQEAPEDLFGTSRDHAGDLYDRWAAEGVLRLEDAGAMTWREVPSFGLGFASFMCLAFAVTLVARGESPREWTLGMVLIPVVLGVAPTAAAAAWDWFLRARGTASAIVSAVATILVLSAAVAAVNEWSKAYPFGTHSAWWYAPVAAVCAALAFGWSRWVATWPPLATPAAVDADEWSARLGGILRQHYSLSDHRVRTIIGEAHAHVADSGRSLQEEFGSPEDYAAGFAPDLARRSGLMVCLYGVVVVLNLVSLVAWPSWSRLVIAAGFAWLGWREYQRYCALRVDSA